MPARKPPAQPDSPLHALERLASLIPVAIHHVAAVEAERDAALCQAKALRARIESACGLPDPAEACRVILSLCREP